MSGPSTVHGPEFRRGDWEYTAIVHIPEIYEDHSEFDRFIIRREPVADLGTFDIRFEFYIPHRFYRDWGPRGSIYDSPWETASVERYADVFAAAEPLVDFDTVWEERTDITEQRRAHLREVHDKDWSAVYSPVDMEYTRAYGDAKRPFTQFARTPAQLEQWRSDAGLDINMGPAGVVLLAFPDGVAPEAGPEPDSRPYWSGIEPEMGEGLPYGWPR